MSILYTHVISGLAHAAIHPTHLASLFPLSMWGVSGGGDQDGAPLATRFDSLILRLILDKTSVGRERDEAVQGGTHAFTILARILRDTRFSPSAIGLPVPEDGNEHELERVERVVGGLLLKYVEEWTVDGADARDVERKIEELSWVNVLLYGVGGWGGRALSTTGEFNADFFL